MVQHMKRRKFIGLLAGAAVWPLAARAAKAQPRIAVLSINSAASESKNIAAFVEGLRVLGHLEGPTAKIDYRYADGDVARLKPLARELVALNPDVVLASATSPIIAVKSVAPNLPVVCPAITDVLVPGLAASYARPGGTVTGIASYVEGLLGKVLELALEALPGSVRIGFLANPGGASMGLWAQQVEAAARARDVAVLFEEARTADDLVLAFQGFAKRQAQAVIVPSNGLFNSQVARIAELALASRLPTVTTYPHLLEAGGLASYGVDVRENFRRAAAHVDKILNGAKPGDLPIEFSTRIVLVINLKTAKKLGIEVPPTLLTRADEVIE
jgi:putative tryptophan/tyrosine transport system substrate-binding protein